MKISIFYPRVGRAGLLLITLTAAGVPGLSTALECVELPGGIDQPLPGVDKNMRQFTEEKSAEGKDDRKTLVFCSTVVAAYQGPGVAFRSCSCNEAIERMCEVEFDHGVPKMKGPAECGIFLPMMI